jgi:hypothetical protein
VEYVVNAGLKPFAGSVVENLVPQLNGSGFVLRRFVHAANHARDQLPISPTPGVFDRC